MTINSWSKAILVAADTAALLLCPVIDHCKDCMHGVVSNLNRFFKTRKLVLYLEKTDTMTFSTNNKTCHVLSVGDGDEVILIEDILLFVLS
jgi:hypothetical protein